MTANYRTTAPSHSTRRALVVILGVGLWAASGVSAQAQEPELSSEAAAASAYASFQYATLTGTTNTINATLLPVVSANGSTALKNVTIQFGFNSSGQLVVTGLQAANAPPPIVAGFKPGKYCGPVSIGNGNMAILVGGPGSTTSGATEWTLSSTGTSDSTYPATASWYVGPIASNPLYSRITAAKIQQTSAYSFGMGGSNFASPTGDWFLKSLLAFSQVNNTLTIFSYTDSSGTDHGLPVDQVTYTACK